MQKLIIILLFSFSLAFGQEIKIGDPLFFEIPFGTKLIDVGFKNRDYVNVSTVRAADNLLLRWYNTKFDSTVIGFALRYGAIKCQFIDKEFGLVPVDSLADLTASCLNFVTAQDVGDTRQYLLRVAKFDYVVQVIAFDKDREIVAISQVRLIKQKHED